MRIDTSVIRPRGLPETDSVMSDLTRQTAKKLQEFQHHQMQTRIAFQKAVMCMAGYGQQVDMYL